MSATITLYTHPWSRGRMARWMLEECGAAYEVQALDYGGSMKAPDYTALNPMGKVPAIRHGAVVVTEVAAICAYLAEQFPERRLAPPADSPERAHYYRWLFFAAGPVEAAVTAKSLGLLAPAEKRAQAGYGSYEDVMDTLEFATRQALARGGHLCAQFTAADLYLAAQLNWGMQFKTVEARPAFQQYVAPILQRPAYLQANALDDALAAQLKPGA
ncbi:glutathione S-transferase family protein [Ottowia sp.]|uniref:glutathione S-transferase family protein n=1 Tax=Ottowia sp. TaxID=1898956 RepID=UPI002D026648|nr:glutathione S-transferase family protein [Ottowia sp.]HRN75866.1 glutathione S-transferase family protein [Ottowia sp.]HRQ03210.1 glutathione S-transferase family protein [Ottowia sp.]